jgi:hypothetical protein
MTISKKSSYGPLFLLLSLLLSLSLSYSQTREKGEAIGAQRPLTEIVGPDGTLKLGPGVRGSYDPKGLRMFTGKDGKPRFVPAGAVPQAGGGPAANAVGDENWDDRFGDLFTNSDVYAIAVNGDDVYVGGYFGYPVGYVAKWNASTRTWSALGEGVDGYVRAIAVSGTDVYVGGYFLNADDIEVNNIAKWDGTGWSALGTGVGGEVWSIAVRGSEVFAGGVFATAGSVAVNNIARWDGNEWSDLEGGMSAGGDMPRVYALAADETYLYAGGYFTVAGGNPAYCVARWDGEAWSALGGGLGPVGRVEVYAIEVSGSNVYVGGWFSEADGLPAKNFAKWDGSVWSTLGGGVEDRDGDGYVFAIAVSGTDVYAGGGFAPEDEDLPRYVARWDGDAWSAMGSGVKGEAHAYCVVSALAVGGTTLYVGGFFREAGGRQVSNIATWDISAGTWPAVGSGVAGSVFAIAVSGTDVYVGGAFETAVGSPIPFLAKWDGTNWTALGTRLSDHVYALAMIGTDLYAGGRFRAEGGFPADYIAKWDGSSWSALGSGVDYGVMSIAASGTDLYVGGYFTTAGGIAASKIAKWDTVANRWSALAGGVGGSGSWWTEWVAAIAVSGADVYAGGVFDLADGIQANHIAKWNGASWSNLGSGLEGEEDNARVQAIVPAGTDIYVGGRFTSAGGSPANSIAKWDGENWSALSAGVGGGSYYPDVNTIAVIGTDVYAGGAFTTADGDPAKAIAKWDGLGWSALGSGLEGRPWYGEGGSVNAMAMSDTGLYMGGEFIMAGGKASANLARWFIPLEVTAPNGGETWEAGSGQTITWTGTAEAVKIEYSADNGATWTTLVESMANTGSLYGAAPNTPSSQCLIRISDTAFPGRSDMSDGTFTITGFIVTSPNGGEIWTAGSVQTITWTTLGSFPTVRLLYSTNDGSTWTEIAASTANTGSYPWTVPATLSTQCLVRIRDASDNNPYDTSDAVFSIVPMPTIVVTSPNGGEIWAAGSTHAITWTYSGLAGNISINLKKANLPYKQLGIVDISLGMLDWEIPGDETIEIDYSINLNSPLGYADDSDGYFSIATAAIRKDDLLGTWDGQGVYYRNSDTEAWVKLASPATKITVGDLDGDGTDDLIGLWPTQGGIWVKYSSTGAWAKLSSTAQYICTGDMNGDGRVDLVGTWDGQGVYYRNSISGAWIKLATPATMVTAGDIDNDGTDDLIGLWPSQGGIWVKYSGTGAWAKLSSTAVHIASGDMNGDGRDDLLGTWDGQGVYYRDSATGAWVKMASPATLIATGDIDGDETDDLIGIWPTQGGVWVKYSSDGTWERLSSTAQDIAAGKMRAAAGGGAAVAGEVLAARQEAIELPLPMGGMEEGPGIALSKKDLSDRGPGGARFVYLEDLNIEPREEGSARLSRIPGPDEAGFLRGEQKNIHPGEALHEALGKGPKGKRAAVNR